MNSTDPTPRPLELPPWLWVALGIVALIGLSAQVRRHDDLKTLDPFAGDPQVIVRSATANHVFPILKVQVAVPKGWSYLSVSDDAIADEPTFVNESASSILRLRPYRFRSWPPVEGAITRRQYASVSIEWIEVDHRRIGRLNEGDVDVSLEVLTHSHKSKLNDAVDDFCNSIQLVSSADG